ncbi:hypothetical protein THOM_0832 [Trachipleistophora hominis]|uniref:Uncharacterized protein n=1 Tax=Trachipleistophora hominis TaxID=72359 RepID=L7JXK9_TRAHO|nr:hypothetical protein THOM_0832 [Trachipleistophora hominis]
MMRKENEVMRRKSFTRIDERYESNKYIEYGAREWNNSRGYGHSGYGANIYAMDGTLAINSYEMRAKTQKSVYYSRKEGSYRIPRLDNCWENNRSHEKNYASFNFSSNVLNIPKNRSNLPYTLFTLTNTALQHRILAKLFISPPQTFFQFTPFVLIIATIYIRRHSYHTGMYNNFMNFFFIGCCIAKKIWNDKVCKVESWMKMDERSALECYFCKNVNYDFIVSEREFGWWTVMLCN